jgi:hypothetical protein
VIEDQAREDIAFIRRAIEEGGAYATASSPDMLVWEIAVAIGYLGSYGFLRGWSPVAPSALWAARFGSAAQWRRRWRCCGSAAGSF